MLCRVFSHAVISGSLCPRGLQPARLLCPWDSLGKNTGVSGHLLLYVIIPTQRSNLGLLHCRWILDPLSHQGKLKKTITGEKRISLGDKGKNECN